VSCVGDEVGNPLLFSLAVARRFRRTEDNNNDEGETGDDADELPATKNISRATDRQQGQEVGR
jgi:hypothetical protein